MDSYGVNSDGPLKEMQAMLVKAISNPDIAKIVLDNIDLKSEDHCLLEVPPQTKQKILLFLGHCSLIKTETNSSDKRIELPHFD